ncbi:MAG: histidine kinase [Lachnospiraceae bacterium]|nr:histidine kinase [Lachnospiraceae bacterium]
MGRKAIKNRREQAMGRHKSLGMKLVISFMGISMIPILLITMFSYYHILNIVNDNNKKLMKYNLSRTKTTLEISVESYQDILVQIYSDDDVVHLINKINRGEDLVVSKNHLRRILRAYLYAKDYIRDLSVITEDGTLVFYDSITGSITRSSWIPNLGIDQKQLYNKYIDENKMFVISTSEAKESLNERNFLFHLGHRIVDYNRRNENIGIIIMSVDEQMLHNICTGDGQDSVAYSFIVDREGKLVSYKDKDLLGSAMINGEKDKKLQYRDFAIQQNIFDRDSVSIDYVHDDKLNWDIVNVSNQHEVLDEIKQQQGITFTIFSFSVAILIVIIAFLTRELTGSIKSVVRIMQSAEEGRRQERVEIDRKMPSEVKVIAHQYNTTMDRLLESVETEKRLDRQKKDAEITALEAQLNPHFLYNTLDTINWIAIGRKEFEISRAITALATILRYGIDNSNGIVTIREEYEWLKQYLFLQQTRLKDGFESTIEIPPEFMELKVHKLLIQPFVENSFVHGFKNIERKPMLKIKMEMWKTDRLQIVIEDNGTGMPQSVAKQMNQGIFQETEDKNQIGLKNALYRIRLYYEEQAQIQVESKEHQYTRIYITLPVSSEGGRKTV